MKTHLRLAATFFFLFAASLRAGEISYAVGDTIDLSLPGGLPSFSLSIVAAPPAGIAGQSYIARDAQSKASAIVKPTKAGLRVTIDDFEHQRIYSVRVRNGVVEASVRDTSGDAGDVCGTCGGDVATPPAEQAPAETNEAASVATPRSSLRLKSALRGSGGAFTVAEQKAVVDILVAFDQGAKAWAENVTNWDGGETMEEFADYAVNKMNMVLEKSQLDDKFFYRLVGVTEVDATYDEINDSLLAKLRTRSGPLSRLGALREKCGADTITLLIDRSKGRTSGIGYEYLPSQWTFEKFDGDGYTCNICDVNTVYDRYTMSHETGHNMGCGHSNLLAGNKEHSYSYSYGYNFMGVTNGVNVRCHTIMAYSYTDVDSYVYHPIPYFSSPEIGEDVYGCAVGTSTNDNRKTLLNTYKGVAAWREHVVPYSWDVRFLDDNGRDIPDGSYFYSSCYVTLTNENPEAEIYYTLDGSSPTIESLHGGSGTKVYAYLVNGSKTLTACAVVDGKAQSVRSITLHDGLTWSGDSNGNGLWLNADSSVRPWNGEYFCNGDAVMFPDLAGVSCATVAVNGVIAPGAAAFTAVETAYSFDKGDDGAKIAIPNADFAPSGDLTFNVPVQMSVTSFTTPEGSTLAFNAPFGQAMESASGYCTNRIVVGNGGTLVVAPGVGMTQYFDSLSTEWFFSSSRFCVGEGTVVFKGPADSSKGVFGNTGIVVGKGGNLVLDFSGSIAGVYSSIAGEGTVVCKSLSTAGSKSWWTDSSWNGTLALTNVAAGTLALDQYGGANSTVRLTGVSGYPGNSGNTNIYFHTTVELTDGVDGKPAWTLNNGFSTDCTFIDRLRGDGTFKSTPSPSSTYVRQGFVVADASGFTGSLDLVGTQFTFGSAARNNDSSQTGTIYVDAGYSVTNAASWKADGLVVNGELVKKGTVTIANSVMFGNGASFVVDSLPAGGVVLTSKAITTNGVLSVGVMDDGRSYVANVVDNGDSTVSLILEKAPLPEKVRASITVQYYDGIWKERVLDFDLPTAWITNYYPTLETVEAVAAKYDEDAANGAKVWQCYMLGLDPTDAASAVSLSMTVVGNEIRFAVEGLGETHALDGIEVQWRMKTSTNLVADAAFSGTREYVTGLSPTFAAHTMPDKPTSSSTATADTLFYKITVTFVAEDEEEVEVD